MSSVWNAQITRKTTLYFGALCECMFLFVWMYVDTPVFSVCSHYAMVLFNKVYPGPGRLYLNGDTPFPVHVICNRLHNRALSPLGVKMALSIG